VACVPKKSAGWSLKQMNVKELLPVFGKAKVREIEYEKKFVKEISVENQLFFEKKFDRPRTTDRRPQTCSVKRGCL
jgi:hypothetical protein